MKEALLAVPGAQNLFDWFGYWPSFHDAEVLSVELNRSGPSKVCVHTFRMTTAVDSKGFYICDKHCFVTFLLEDISEMELANFNDGNVLLDLELFQEKDQFVIALSATYGLEGKIKAKKLSIQTTPGIPSDSQYKKPNH